MKPITIYSTAHCGYCRAAKRFLESLALTYSEVDLSDDPAERDRISAVAKMHTVPMIFFGEDCIGGYMELVGLHRSGRLEGLLAD